MVSLKPSQVRGDEPERDDAGHLGGVLGVVGGGHAAHLVAKSTASKKAQNQLKKVRT